MNTIVTGSIAFDYLMRFPGRFVEHILPDQLHRVSLSFLVDQLERRPGGCAANIAYNLALLGERPRMMGTAGHDFAEHCRCMEQIGVDTSLTRIESDLFTASFFANTDLDGNQIASFYTGAMARARELSLRGLEADLVVISPNDPAAMVKYAAECQELGIPYLYDPSQQIVRMSGEDLLAGLEGCDLLVVNEYEFGLLCEKTGLGAADIRSAPTRACIVTHSAEGALIWAEGTLHVIPPALPEQIQDPTGVGDAFRAGLIKGLALDLPWGLIGRMGAMAATIVLEQPCPQGHHFTPAEFVARFRAQFDDDGALDVLEYSSKE